MMIDSNQQLKKMKFIKNVLVFNLFLYYDEKNQASLTTKLSELRQKAHSTRRLFIIQNFIILQNYKITNWFYSLRYRG